MKNTVGQREKDEEGIWQERKGEQKSSSWVAMNASAKEFPLLNTYYYVNLIMHWGWAKVLHKNAAQCVYVQRFPWSK